MQLPTCLACDKRDLGRLLCVARLLFISANSPSSIQQWGKTWGEKLLFFFFFVPVTNLCPLLKPLHLVIYSCDSLSKTLSFMLVLFLSFLSSGGVFPLSGPPWISAAFLHCTVQQQSPRGRERNVLKRLGTDTEQARLGTF